MTAPTSAQLRPVRAVQGRTGGVASPWQAFDANLRSGSPALSQWLEPFTQSLLDDDARSRNLTRRRRPDDAQRFRLAVEALVCNLLALRLYGHELPLSVPRSNGAMKGGIMRYRNPVFGEHFPHILDLLVTQGLIEERQRGHNVPGGPKQPSLYLPTEAFLQALPSGSLGWDALAHEDPSEVLVLKGKRNADDDEADDDRQRPLDYLETEATAAMRGELQRLNARLRSAPLEVVNTDAPGFTSVDPGRRSLRRIFSNGSWTEGGRLYDGFWETMERPQRFRHLRIDGERIANVDYGQLYLRLAYAMRGLQAPLDADLYQWPEIALERDHVKVLVNAMLFSRKPLGRIPSALRGKIGKGQLIPARQAVEERHAEIAGSFHRGLGHHLSFLESALLLDVMRRLEDCAIVGLPVHDSVLVAESRAVQTQSIMEQAFRDRFGGLHVPVEIKRAESA